jgi:hypothetical protein
MRVDEWGRNRDAESIVFIKGVPGGGGPQCPYVSVYDADDPSNPNVLNVAMDTFKGVEKIKINNMPSKKFFHIIVRVTDSKLKVYVDGNLAANVYRNFNDSQPFVTTVNMSAGSHVLKFEALNDGSGDNWSTNPAGWGVIITGSIVWDTQDSMPAETLVNTSFYSPVVYPVTSSAGDWNSFMNSYAVWVRPNAESVLGVTQTRHRMFQVLQEGPHTFTYAVDDHMNVFIDDALRITSDVSTSRRNNAPGTKVLYLREGTYVIRVDAYNNPIRGGWAITITHNHNKTKN